uniref:Secreted protein n=1 Tax=Ixodes scapularis TaxID=6945 RepID=A0A4D5RDX2_IXOSC
MCTIRSGALFFFLVIHCVPAISNATGLFAKERRPVLLFSFLFVFVVFLSHVKAMVQCYLMRRDRYGLTRRIG